MWLSLDDQSRTSNGLKIGFGNTACGRCRGPGDSSLIDTASLWCQPSLFNSFSFLSLSLSVCVCTCTCVYVHVRVCVYMHEHMEHVYRASDDTPQASSTFMLRQGLWLWSGTCLLGKAGRKGSLRCLSPPLSCWDYKHSLPYLDFYVGSGGSNSSP